jgi:hypothetical protein
MNDSWYKNFLPKIKETNIFISNFKKELFASSNDCKKIFAWGEYAQKIDKDNETIKEVDIIVQSSLKEDDLISITDGNNSPLKIKSELLIDLGFNPECVNFTKNLLKLSNKNLSNLNINIWIVSSNKKLLHWGPIQEEAEEWSEIKEEAEKYANRESESTKNSWVELYKHHLSKYSNNMPKGWYLTNTTIKNIQKEIKEI